MTEAFLLDLRNRAVEIKTLKDQMEYYETMHDSRGARLFNRYSDMVARYCADAEKVETAIQGLEPVEKAVIRGYYLAGPWVTWEQVASNLQYSLRQVHRYRASALAKLAKLK